ncbi:hypothetical protein BDP55DRAFT_407051 [Colletotrichum godetiae]|uniref:Uncharacterized protein n=1 Tax=Colletotrichum godetiae TaxID=1209918 RepID=A0AAJ0AT87_9PEZI|nr:uncharacterized protein BDP55DRAFT_407051 [Colletotrichum godetiae]KAK1689363.1 hypothetical protein BDP55DRAFT_407051 [Colletotrichum godetiae]
MATYLPGTQPFNAAVSRQSIGLLENAKSQSSQGNDSTSLEICKYEDRQRTEEEKRSQSLALIQRISERHLIKQQESPKQPRSRELQQYLDVLQDAIPRLPDDYLLPGTALPMITLPQPRLSHPVIIPQGGFRTSTPKFSRTYPPGLQNCGISKNEFFRFVDDLNRLDDPSVFPGDQAVNTSGFKDTAGLTASHPMPIAIAIGLAAKHVKRIPKHSAMSEVLLRANGELFRPRGLICVLVACERAEAKEANISPERKGHVVSTNGLDRSREKKLKLRKKVGVRLRDFGWPILPQVEVDDKHDFYPDLDNKRLPLRHSYRSRRRRSPSSEGEEKRGLGRVIEEHYETEENIGEGRQRQSTSRCAKLKHPANTENETLPLDGNKVTPWELGCNRLSDFGLVPGRVEVGRLPADFFTAEGDKSITLEEALRTDSESIRSSAVKQRISSDQRKTLDSDALYLMITNAPHEVNIFK